jgi:pyruvate dehydrogenase E1 component beta subunit
MLMNVPGLRILVPRSPQDSLSILRMAIRSDDPVVILEHDLMYFDEGPVREDDLPSLDSAAVLCEGSLLTLIAWSRMANLSLAVARKLKAEGISVEVVDLRSLSPVDWETLVRSTGKTHRALIVEEDGRFAGGGAEIAATLSERCFPLLDSPVRRLAGLFVPTPFNKALESATIPDEKSIENAIRMSLAG